jgi:uncharacterized SAM-binding protein YcdF (DUF218 family)
MEPGHLPEQPALMPSLPPTPLPKSGEKGKGRWRRRFLSLGVLGALVAVVFLLHPLLLPAAARWLDVSEPPTAVDDVMVLGGDAKVRPFVAAALYNRELAQRVLVPTVKPSPQAAEGLVKTESEIMVEILRKRGVPAAAIEQLPGEVDSTADEAAALARYLADKPNRRVAVVTTCYHTRRVRLIFRKVLGAAADRLHFIGGPTEGFDASNWWRSEAGTGTYMNEFAKLPYYFVKY